MKRRTVVWSPDAEGDLEHIQDCISDAGSPVNALRFIGRIAAFGHSLELASERGERRSQILPGLRVVGFERRVTIAFTVDEDAVTILRVFYGGVDWERTP